MTWHRQILPSAALMLAAGLVLSGCSGDDTVERPTTGSPSSTGASGSTADDSGATAEPSGPPTTPAKIPAVPGKRSASGDSSIIVDGDRAAFALPSGNMVCTLNERSAVCEILDGGFAPQSEHLVVDGIGACTAQEANAMMLNQDRGAWTCLDSSLVRQATVGQGGWWVKEVDGVTTKIGKSTVAVLPYGSSLSVGPVSCSSAEDSITCSSSTLGKEFTLSRTGYSYG